MHHLFFSHHHDPRVHSYDDEAAVPTPGLGERIDWTTAIGTTKSPSFLLHRCCYCRRRRRRRHHRDRFRC